MMLGKVVGRLTAQGVQLLGSCLADNHLLTTESLP